MGLKFTTTKEVSNFVKVMCYSESGMGKTVLCGTAPSPLIISAESGLLSLADKNIPVIEVSTADDCFEALEFVQYSAEAKNFETVCLDSITDIAEVLISAYKKEFLDARQAYGKMADDVASLIRSFRDLPEKHVYFTAKQGSIEDSYSGLIKYAPVMPGRTLTTALPFFFDEVLALRIQESEDGSKWRYLQTSPDLQFTAKDRSGKLAAIERPDLTYLFDKILKDKDTTPEEVNETVSSSEKKRTKTNLKRKIAP